MAIQLDHAGVMTAAGALEVRVGDMASRRAQVEASVDSLLATWRGDAAARFTGFWEEWRSSADAVIANLETSVAAVRHADHLLTDADLETGRSHARLLGRLG